MNNKGQQAIPALFSVGVLILGVLFSWPVVSDFFNSLGFTDPLMQFLLGASGICILVASSIAFFVFLGVGSGQ